MPRLLATASLLVVIFGCQQVPAPNVEPVGATVVIEPESMLPAEVPAPSLGEQWHKTLLSINPLGTATTLVDADSTLMAFAEKNDGSCEAAEAGYLRALILLSPEFKGYSPASALPLVDRYLTSVCLASPRFTEVVLVKRMAQALASRNPEPGSTADAELKRLRDELEQTRKELERLKMRVIPPRDTLPLSPGFGAR